MQRELLRMLRGYAKYLNAHPELANAPWPEARATLADCLQDLVTDRLACTSMGLEFVRGCFAGAGINPGVALPSAEVLLGTLQ